MENKKPKLMIGTPHTGIFTPQYVMALSDTYIGLGDKYDIYVSISESAQINLNRNIITKNAYDLKMDWLLFIDTDMAWAPKDVDKLVGFNKDICVGLCTTRKMPIKFCVYESDGHGQFRSFTDIPKTPFRIFASGTAFMLLKSNLFRRMWDERYKEGYPFDPIPHGLPFSTVKSETGFMGTDMSFCQRARKLDYEIWCDPSVRVGHVGTTVCGAKNEH